MRPEEIENILKRLENGEISEDDSTDNEDDIDYYSSQRDRLMELDDEEDVGNFPTDPNLDADPPAANVDTDMQHNLETVERNPTPTTSSQNNLQTAPFNSRNLVWRVKNMDLVQNAFQFAGNTEYSQEIMNLDTPFQFFSYFFGEDILRFLVDESNKYAFQKNPNFTEPVTVLELRKFIGILIFTSVYHYPSVRSYWSNITKFEPIVQTMNRNRFDKIREIFHMNDDSKHLPIDHPQHDRLHKVRPVIDYLNKKFITLPFEHRLSLDEQMCSTKMKHFMKQYLPNKPHKWGFKLYVLCSLSGYAYSFEIYSGAKDMDCLPGEPDLGAVSNTVIRLLRPVPRHVNHIIYFDNFYTNIPLVHYLTNEGIYCLGTVQRNRLGKSCKLPEKREIMKSNVPRGTYHENVASHEGLELSATSWKDNKQVLLLSTYVGAEPADTITRYEKKLKANIQISCPRVVKEYNAHMGGVDLMDSFIGRYRIRIKSRKWTTRLFYHLLDMTVINAWVLYKKVNTRKGKLQKNIMKLADFRTELADTLCRYQSHSKNKRGRPSTNSQQDNTVPSKKPRTGAQVLPPTDVRSDCIGHEKIFMESRNKCKFSNCRKLTSWFCKKCKVSLCDNKNNRCFALFHA